MTAELRKLLRTMTPEERVEHLLWLVEELTTPPEPRDDERLECLTPAQRRIVSRLLRAEGKIVPAAHLLAASSLETDPDDWPGSKVVPVQISKARQRLAAAGVPLVIKGRLGQEGGYVARWAQ